ncbi:ATP-binding cassette domain-containing protein [Streptomyces sp. NPDC000987]|uniref:ABC transporter ATP-binding protein n=1 Tax=Streptomyces sp. NPDC000987 TaxID=3154374 RepID=UPI00332D6372
MTTTTGTRTAARVVDAVKVYGRGDTAVRALDGVSVDFPAGRFTAIMGPSGSGKSTLMHCAAGLDTLTSGAAFVGDTDLGGLDDRRLTLLRRDRVGFVFQAFDLVPTLTVLENITLPLDLAGEGGDPEWTDALVDVVGLRDRLHHRPAELSPSTAPAPPARGPSPERASPSSPSWPHGHSGRREPAPSWRWCPSCSSARPSPARPYAPSAAPSAGCAASPGPSPGATPCAVRGGRPPPPPP